MATLEIRDLHVSVDTENGPKEILRGVDLTIAAGQTHAIMGPNGSGKSTLAYSIAGHPKYNVTSGTVTLDGEDVLDMAVDERARAGLFLAMQYPVEVPGVSVSNFLRTAKTAIDGEAPKLRTWVKDVNKALSDLDMDADFGQRNVNEGFSGGEKKRHEIVQLELLNPKIAILDETDSGLDIDALKIVSTGVNRFAEQGDKGVLLITHYTRILRYIKPDFVHVFVDGKVAEEGGAGAGRRARGQRLRALPEAQAPRHDGRPDLQQSAGPAVGPGGLPDPRAGAGRTASRWSTWTRRTRRRSRSRWSRRCEDHYLLHNANVARAMHQLGAEATAAYEGGRDKVAAFIGATEPGRDRLHQERLRGAQPGRAHARRRAEAGGRGGDLRDGAPQQHRPVAARLRADRRHPALVRRHRRGPARPVEHRRADHRADQGRLADLGLERARHDQPDHRDRRQGPRGRRDCGRRRLAGGAAVPGRRLDARRGPARLHRPQGGRPDRVSACSGAGTSCSPSCRRSSVAAR